MVGERELNRALVAVKRREVPDEIDVSGKLAEDPVVGDRALDEGDAFVDGRFSRSAESRLSTTTTLPTPPSSSAATRLEPTKPAPPATRTLLPYSSDTYLTFSSSALRCVYVSPTPCSRYHSIVFGIPSSR